MSHMIGYLGGDSDTLAARRALTEDLRLAVEFPVERKMLVVIVMQTGEIMLSWDQFSAAHTHASRPADMYLVGVLTSKDGGLTHDLDTDLPPIPNHGGTVHYIDGGKVK